MALLSHANISNDIGTFMTLQVAATALTVNVLRQMHEKFFQSSSTTLYAKTGRNWNNFIACGKHRKSPESDFTLYQ